MTPAVLGGGNDRRPRGYAAPGIFGVSAFSWSGVAAAGALGATTEYITWIAGANAFSLGTGRNGAPNYTASGLASHAIGGAVGGVAIKGVGQYVVAPAFRHAIVPGVRRAGGFIARELADAGIITPTSIRLGRMRIVFGFNALDDAAGVPRGTLLTNADELGLIGVPQEPFESAVRRIAGFSTGAKPRVLKIQAFGSRAGSPFRGRGPTAGSDLDLLVTVDPKVLRRGKLVRFAQRILGRANPDGVASLDGVIAREFAKDAKFPLQIIVDSPIGIARRIEAFKAIDPDFVVKTIFDAT